MNHSTSLLSSQHSLGSFPSPGGRRDRSNSPSRAKIQQLNERLAGVNTSFEVERHYKIETMDTKIRELDDKVIKDNYANEDNIRAVKHQITVLQEGVAAEAASREILDHRKTNEIKLVEKNVVIDFNGEKQKRKDTEQKIVARIEDKIFALRTDVSKEQKSEDEIVQKRTKEVIEQLAEISEGLENEEKSRKESNEKLVRRLEEEVERLESAIEKERKARDQTENILFKMLEDISGRLQNEITTEHTTRNKSEELMLSLLEETCNKIETQFKYY